MSSTTNLAPVPSPLAIPKWCNNRYDNGLVLPHVHTDTERGEKPPTEAQLFAKFHRMLMQRGVSAEQPMSPDSAVMPLITPRVPPAQNPPGPGVGFMSAADQQTAAAIFSRIMAAPRVHPLVPMLQPLTEEPAPHAAGGFVLPGADTPVSRVIPHIPTPMDAVIFPDEPIVTIQPMSPPSCASRCLEGVAEFFRRLICK